MKCARRTPAAWSGAGVRQVLSSSRLRLKDKQRDAGVGIAGRRYESELRRDAVKVRLWPPMSAYGT